MLSVSGINTNTSSLTDESYIYLPNGGMQDINPILIAEGIDSRENQSGKYQLVEGNDYNITNSFVEGNGVGTYTYRFTGSQLYTSYRESKYRIFQKNRRLYTF